ncbi:MAG: hypothetical protein CSA65_01430 [Proteobacteria bacterium]|nr:MAG: hypothetical protein CSA65_01430 [Pseudomonadota bacterium]
MRNHGVGARRAPAGSKQPTSNNRCDFADQRSDGRSARREVARADLAAAAAVEELLATGGPRDDLDEGDPALAAIERETSGLGDHQAAIREIDRLLSSRARRLW